MQFSNCIAVKGFSRTAIYDVQRTRYILIENDFADLLLKFGNKIPVNEFENKWKHYIDKLVGDEWGILTTKKIANLFPPLNLQWKHYAEITNAVVDISSNENEISYFFNSVLPQFEGLSCKSFQINFVNPINHQQLLDFLEYFDDTHVHFLIIQLPYIILTAEENKALFNLQPRLKLIQHFSCPSNINKNEKSSYSEKTPDVRNLNIISPNYFTTNITFFSESQRFNTYFNRKVGIDAHGNIKNSPEQTINHGNIKSSLISEVIKSDTFKILWYIHKGMIDVCKDCEFRHMCVDSCALAERKNGTWYRLKECNYNPYIAKWDNEEGYKTLSKCGVNIQKEKFSINRKKLATINTELWGE